jgi:formylglycine-generating enzyme required for sulfatase activity
MKNWVNISSGCGLSGYEIMKYPVTNEDYLSFLNSKGSAHYSRLMATHFFGGVVEDGGKFVAKVGFGRKPVVFVSWYDAKAYAEWAGARLPTAKEWRHAAAWMPKEGRLSKYCTGNDEPPTQSEANYYDFENGWALPAPHLADVDWYKPSGAFGLCGMAGNVAEWVDGETSGGWKMALGGSLFRPVDFLRTDAGEADHPSKRLSTFGFRLARDVEK